VKKSRFPIPPAIPHSTALYAVARFACNQVERCAADLVLAAMPGGQGTLLAAQALWAATRSEPFPPVATIHLSEQHVWGYTGRPHLADNRPLIGFLLGIMEAGPYMAWMEGQTAWQAELSAAIERALGAGRTPASVIVLGESDPDETTAPLALGLLAAVCPEARARYVAGMGGSFDAATYWPIHFVEEWVNGPQAAAIPDLPTSGEEWGSIGADLISLALAGETAGPETLVWQTRKADHPAIGRLSPWFPQADLEAMPDWTAGALREVVLACHRSQSRPRRRPRTGPKPPRQRPTLLDAPFAIGRELWLRRRLTAAEAAGAAGITVEDATARLEQEPAPGLLEVEESGGERTYCLRNQAAILAYGSLRADPGPELSPYVERRIAVTTPFPVEYVRSSPTRAGAPVLVPVPEGYGAAAPAEVLVLAPEIGPDLARAMLQRRKLDRTTSDDMWFAEDAEEMPVRELHDFAGQPLVLYAAGAPNLPEVIPDDVPLAERGAILARLALASVTSETAEAGHDGIRYLARALDQGIVTPLTEPYRAAVLRLAAAPDLGAAYLASAVQLGITIAES